MLGSVACYLWWLVAGTLLGWVAYWLIDKLFLRSPASAQRLADAERAADTHRAELLKRTTDLTDARAQLGNLTSRVEQFTARESTLKGELASLLADRDGFKTRLSAFESTSSTEIADLKAKLNDYVAAYNSVVAERDTIKGQLATTTETVNRMMTADVKEHELIASLQAEVEKTRKEAVSGANDAAARASQIEQLKAQLQQTQGQHSSLLKQFEEVQVRLQRVSSEGESRGSEVSRLQTQLAEANTKVTSRTADLESLRAEAEHMRKQLASAGDASKLTAQLNGDLATARARIVDLEAQAQANARSASELAQALARVAELETAAKSYGRLSEDLATAKADSDRVNKELHVAQEWLTRMGLDLEKAKAGQQSAADEAARLRGEIGTLNAQIAGYQKLRDALEAARRAAELGLDLGNKS